MHQIWHCVLSGPVKLELLSEPLLKQLYVGEIKKKAEYKGVPIFTRRVGRTAYQGRVRSAESPLFQVVSWLQVQTLDLGQTQGLYSRPFPVFLDDSPLITRLNINITKLQKEESSRNLCVYFASTWSTNSSSIIDVMRTLRHSVIEAWF